MLRMTTKLKAGKLAAKCYLGALLYNHNVSMLKATLGIHAAT